jgi:predicted metal-dependent phosphotriesterase family hydrolase
VTGSLEASEVGTTPIHEHFRARDESNAEQFPHLYDDALYRPPSRRRAARSTAA